MTLGQSHRVVIRGAYRRLREGTVVYISKLYSHHEMKEV